MILPNKYIKEQDALLGVGAQILKSLHDGKDLFVLWDEIKAYKISYERFILALDMLYIFGAIDIQNNKIVKVHKQ